MALARAQNLAVEQYNTFTSPEVPNYSMSTLAAVAIGTKALIIDGLSECGGLSYSNLFYMAFFAGMAVNQYGLQNTRNLIVNNTNTLFATVKAKIMPVEAPQEEVSASVKKTM